MAAPNLYALNGSGLHVSYATTSFAGPPQFHYQDGFRNLTFSGTEIATTASPLGTLVTVYIFKTIDSGSTSFTLLVPRVNLPPSNTAPIHTYGITTVHRFSIVPQFMQGQLDTYSVANLHGTAELVAF